MFTLKQSADTWVFYWQENIPTVSILCNPGIRARHWEQMSEVAGFDLKPDSGTTLRKVLRLSLTSFLDKFESISAAASKVKMWMIITHQSCKCIMGKLAGVTQWATNIATVNNKQGRSWKLSIELSHCKRHNSSCFHSNSVTVVLFSTIV